MRDTIVIYPDIAAKAIKIGIVSELRAWMAFHASCENGHVFKEDMFNLFTTKKSGSYVFGRRRMKDILKSGEGLFWDTVRDGTVIRLAGKDTLAKRLGIEQLEFQSVKFETTFLFGTFKLYKAALLDALYASFNRPISRLVIERLTGVSKTTQQELEALIGTRVVANYLWVEKEEDDQESAWKQGGKLVRRWDRTGRITGQKDSLYYAEKMPNTYYSKQKLAGKGSRREYNKTNSFRRITSLPDKPKRLYSTPESHSSKAAYEKQCDVIVQSRRSESGLSNEGIWVKTWR